MADEELTPSTDEPEADQPHRDWQAEATKWKALARKHEKAAKENVDAARRLAEIEESGKSEQERLAEARQSAEERAQSTEREAGCLRVALRKGLTDVQARRLVGDTEDELEADADEFLATFAPAQASDTDLPSRPRERLRPGARPEATPDETDPAPLAEAIPRSAF
ncbi:MAG: hypothetical protein CVU47_04835 [Chloroflexi bacterium HGW-Chloroflexi-9]|nr:MAG: hypothetical protein CVU47_04835 [Chloroflexi bacterium HGW-Chloroflexi-9]